ncbi:MAG: BspA family leucine-rich repeat surface protein [Bacteroidales bacterium]|nr:BspA family leucine-rich repeat surface protein [Bacteroidales bacterium]
MRAIMVMLVMLASVTAGAQETAEMASWVLLSKNNNTLYFVRDNVAHQKKEDYKGIFIDLVWRIADKADPQGAKTTNKAPWSSAKKFCTKVVFEDSFSAARPIYCKDWFNGLKNLTTIEGIKNLNTDEVTTMKSMFYECKLLTELDLSGFNTSKVTDMSHMFRLCRALNTLHMDGFDTSNVTDMSSMFRECDALIELDLSKFDATSVTDIANMFYGCDALKTLNMSGFKAPNLETMESLFQGCSALEEINMSGFNTGNVTSLSRIIYTPRNSLLREIDLRGMEAPELTDMSDMFRNCTSLKTADLGDINAPKLTDMSNLFSGKKISSSLETADLGGINAPSLNKMNSMFQNCSALTSLNLIGLNAPNVTNMNNMFQGCSALTTLDLRDLHNTYIFTNKSKTLTIIKPVNTNNMFDGCSDLVSIFVDNTKWSKVDKGGKEMFKHCNSLVGEDGVTTIEKCDADVLVENGMAYAHTNKGGLLTKYGYKYLLTGDFVTFYHGEDEVNSARVDDIITMKVNVPEGNTLKELTAMCGENPVTLSYNAEDDVYTFTMPVGAVTVATAFSGTYTLTGVGVTLSVGNETVAQAKTGTTVSYKLSIPEGKELDEVMVMQGEYRVPFTQYEDGTGQFTMPAGDVTVTATYADIPVEPVAYTLTGEDNMSFYYVDGGKAEADETGIIKVWAGNDIIVKVDESEEHEGQAVDVLTVKQGETSLEVKTNEDGDLYFMMPEGDVVVSATYMDPYPLESGVEVDAESGEREKDYVDFFNDKPNLISEAFRGEKVWVDVNPDVIPANMYFTGEFTSTDVTIVEEDEYNHYFIMPAKKVTVDAEMAPQQTLVFNLTSDAPVALDGKVMNREMASLMSQWEGYLVDIERVENHPQENNETQGSGETQGSEEDPNANQPKETDDYTLSRFYDFDGDGKQDVVLIELSIDGEHEPTYTIQRLEGAASLGENYCLTLRSPGLPLKYKDALFNFGKSETITCVFFFEELSNKHTLANYDGKTVNVSFPERILYKDGDWNTICLPFDVTVAGSPLDGDGVTVKTLKGASLENGTLALTFTEGSETELKAGVPYLIKWEKPDPYVAFNYEHPELASDLYAPTFKNVTLDITLKPVVVTDLIAFDGTYTSWEYKQDSPSVLLMGAENNLYYPQYYSYLNCFRAYFQLLGGIKAIDPGLGGSIKSMVIDFGEEETDIEELKDGEKGDVKNEGWYTLSGVKLAGKPSVSGIYLFNGKKVAVQ